MVTEIILASSVLGNVTLALLYGRAARRAAERDNFEQRTNTLSKMVVTLGAKVSAKENRLRELEKELAGHLSVDDLVGKLNKLRPPGSGSGGDA